MTESALGNVLMLTKSGSRVHLDWSADAGTGPYVVKRSTSWDFSGAASIAAPLPGKSYDDPVLANGTDYAYRIFRRSLTDSLSYYHVDHLGTPLAMTNASAALTWRAEHYPFGAIYSATGAGSNNLRFPGQYADAETGYFQNWHRDYVPWLGRYGEVDPVGVLASPIDYDYARDNPLIFLDPRGLTWGENPGILFNFLAGTGSSHIWCSTAAMRELQGSPGVAKVRREYVKNNCPKRYAKRWRSWEAAGDLLRHPLNGTTVQMGGFLVVFRRSHSRRCTVRVHVSNLLSAYSFLYHVSRKLQYPRSSFRFLGNVGQDCQWREPNPCGCCR